MYKLLHNSAWLAINYEPNEDIEKNGNKISDFSEKAGAFVVSFRKREGKADLKDLEKNLEKDLEKMNLTENQKKIFFEISRNRNIPQKEISLKVGINEKNVRNNIADLKEKGLLERVGPDKGGYWEIIKKL